MPNPIIPQTLWLWCWTRRVQIPTVQMVHPCHPPISFLPRVWTPDQAISTFQGFYLDPTSGHCDYCQGGFPSSLPLRGTPKWVWYIWAGLPAGARRAGRAFCKPAQEFSFVASYSLAALLMPWSGGWEGQHEVSSKHARCVSHWLMRCTLSERVCALKPLGRLPLDSDELCDTLSSRWGKWGNTLTMVSGGPVIWHLSPPEFSSEVFRTRGKVACWKGHGLDPKLEGPPHDACVGTCHWLCSAPWFASFDILITVGSDGWQRPSSRAARAVVYTR